MKLTWINYFLLTVILLFSFSAFSQQKSTGTLKGTLIDLKTKKPLDYVSFAIKNVKDSTVAAMGATTTTGNFSSRGLTFGQYKFYAAMIGYKPIIKAFEVTAEKPAADFGQVAMEESAITLNDVLIKGELLPMIIKKDTIEFAADAFKTQADANVEDVLKVMPGMVVDKDGNITFNGKKIDRVLVEGKDFFGTNPKTATQNLPKEIVSKIQVIEKQTDEALFKGIDDGKRENVLNIVLKEDKKKGYFGNIRGGKAGGDLYDAAFNVNRFTGKKQISVIAFSNNVNKTGFGMDGLTDFFGGDMFSSGIIGGYAQDSRGNVTLGFSGEGVSSDNGFGGGINDNKGAGLNYNDEWGKNKKFPNKIYFNYLYMRNNGIRESISSRLNLLGQDSYFNDKQDESNATTSRQRFSLKLDLALDSTTKLQILPNFGFSSNKLMKSSIFSSYTETLLENLNNGNAENTNDSSTPTYGGRISLNKRLKKKGRSLFLSVNGNHNGTDIDGTNKSSITLNNNGQPTVSLLNQLIDQTGEVNGYGFNADYAEPIGKKVTLSVNYAYSKREDVVVRSVYDYNTTNTRYDLINNNLSRDLQNFNESHGVGLRLNFVPTQTLSLSLNATQKYVVLTGNNLIDNSTTKNSFVLLQPNFYLSYKMTKTSSLSLNGSRYVGTPSISQLQPIVDNSNPLLITTGNPNLKPSADNSLSLSYNRFGPSSGSSINFSLYFSSSEGRIINNSVLDPATGIQRTYYDNIDGNYNMNARLGAGLKIKSIGLSINPSVSVSRAKNNSFLNRNIVSSTSTGYGVSANLNYALGSTLQFYNYISGSRREVAYSYNNLPNANFTTIYNNLSLVVSLPYEFRFSLSSDLVYNANVGIGADNDAIHNANVSFEKFFLKKALILKATVSDVFNNSRNTNRSTNETYILNSIDLEMRRYFLMSLSYRLRKFGETVK